MLKPKMNIIFRLRSRGYCCTRGRWAGVDKAWGWAWGWGFRLLKASGECGEVSVGKGLGFPFFGVLGGAFGRVGMP